MGWGGGQNTCKIAAKATRRCGCEKHVEIRGLTWGKGEACGENSVASKFKENTKARRPRGSSFIWFAEGLAEFVFAGQARKRHCRSFRGLIRGSRGMGMDQN